jgi:beta-lactamase superfamily II metal-dependent hydrolase
MEMKIEVFDVGHGHSSVITTPAGHKIMLDCGTRSGDRLWWPSTHHLGEEIAMLALMNLDEDHIRDFGDVNRQCKVRSVLTNPTIGAAELRALKPEPRGPGAKAVLQWLDAPKGNAPQNQLDVLWGVFWNHHGGPCKTTNDLSLALFVRHGNFTVLFAGDLEAEGWAGMLRNNDFRQWAASVNMLVASHHGRESGCCGDCSTS